MFRPSWLKLVGLTFSWCQMLAVATFLKCLFALQCLMLYGYVIITTMLIHFVRKRTNWPSARLLSNLVVSSIRLIWNIDSHLLAIGHIYFNANIGMHWNAVQHNNGSDNFNKRWCCLGSWIFGGMSDWRGSCMEIRILQLTSGTQHEQTTHLAIYAIVSLD